MTACKSAVALAPTPGSTRHQFRINCRTRPVNLLAAAGKVFDWLCKVLDRFGLLAELLLAECDDRDRRSSTRRVKAATFPRDKWLGHFDFDANPNINAAAIHTLATGEWIRRGQPCV